MSSFKKATKSQAKLHMVLSGASGSGKTETSLGIGTNLGKRVAVIDTEMGSAAKAASRYNFDVCEVTGDYDPRKLIKLLSEAGECYDVLIVDSLTHFWNGTPNGFLDLVEQEGKRMTASGKKVDSFASWKQISPIYNAMVHAILSCKAHTICTVRSKMAYDRTNGKVTKIGLEPEMREGFTYEMDIEGILNENHDLVIGKTRCAELDGKLFHKAGKDLADILNRWLSDGEINLHDTPPPTVPPPGDMPAIPRPPEMPSSTVLVDAFERRLHAAKENSDALKLIAAEASVAHKENRINKQEFLDLGKVYTEMLPRKSQTVST